MNIRFGNVYCMRAATSDEASAAAEFMSVIFDQSGNQSSVAAVTTALMDGATRKDYFILTDEEDKLHRNLLIRVQEADTEEIQHTWQQKLNQFYQKILYKKEPKEGGFVIDKSVRLINAPCFLKELGPELKDYLLPRFLNPNLSEEERLEATEIMQTTFREQIKSIVKKLFDPALKQFHPDDDAELNKILEEWKKGNNNKEGEIL